MQTAIKMARRLHERGVILQESFGFSRDAVLLVLSRPVAIVRSRNRWSLSLVEEDYNLHQWLEQRQLTQYLSKPLQCKLQCQVFRQALRKAVPLYQLKPLYYAGEDPRLIACEFDVPHQVVDWAIRMYIMTGQLKEWLCTG